MFPPSVIIPASVIHPYYDGAMASILYPSTDSSFSGSIQPVAIIKNKGNLPIEPKKISYKVNALPAVTENLFAYLSPGDSLIYQFTTLLNLPDNQTCSLRTYLSTPGDSIHSNDTASVVFKNLYNFAEKFPMSVGLKVYPNPAGDYIFFRLPVSVKEGRVEVFDIEGRLFYSTDLTGGQGNAESSIDLRGLPAGTCLISVNADGKMYVQKFVKK